MKYPLICFLIAFTAYKSKHVNFIIVGFLIMLLGSIIFASGIVVVDLNMIFYMSLVVVASGTYTIRALYFSIMQEGKIPIALTGTAVGVISVIGYMPDIFATPLFGYFLDKHPGIMGHQYVFGILTIFSIVGLSASIKFAKLIKK